MDSASNLTFGKGPKYASTSIGSTYGTGVKPSSYTSNYLSNYDKGSSVASQAYSSSTYTPSNDRQLYGGQTQIPGSYKPEEFTVRQLPRSWSGTNINTLKSKTQTPFPEIPTATQNYSQFNIGRTTSTFKKPDSQTQHYGVTCNGCRKTPILGTRYKCLSCDDFDFCEVCYQQSQHQASHSFRPIILPETPPSSLLLSPTRNIPSMARVNTGSDIDYQTKNNITGTYGKFENQNACSQKSYNLTKYASDHSNSNFDYSSGNGANTCKQCTQTFVEGIKCYSHFPPMTYCKKCWSNDPHSTHNYVTIGETQPTRVPFQKLDNVLPPVNSSNNYKTTSNYAKDFGINNMSAKNFDLKTLSRTSSGYLQEGRIVPTSNYQEIGSSIQPKQQELYGGYDSYNTKPVWDTQIKPVYRQENAFRSNSLNKPAQYVDVGTTSVYRPQIKQADTSLYPKNPAETSNIVPGLPRRSQASCSKCFKVILGTVYPSSSSNDVLCFSCKRAGNHPHVNQAEKSWNPTVIGRTPLY